MRLRILAAYLFVAACSADKSEARDPEPSELAPLRIGTVMMENGRRFETAGHAARNERWELAAYEAQEMLELFEEDMPRALLPGDCDDTIADRTYETLRDEQLAALREAAEAEDAARFDRAFAAASNSCNGCHAACRAAFIEVPSRPGEPVPAVAQRP